MTEDRPDAPNVVDQTINCAEGARATLGMDISEVMVLEKELSMQTGVTDSGRVTGRVERLGRLLDLLAEKRSSYDAIALATRITPHIDTVELHRAYFGKGGPNPWGGVEAVLTHLISSVLDVPSAHAPTMSSEALRGESWGVVEPRKAMEIISTTYLFCVLKGLNKAPHVVVGPTGVYDPSILTAEDISALVIPDGCVGLPTLAAVEQGIPVIAVRNNTNLMRNDLRALPFKAGQLRYAQNYYEAAGIHGGDEGGRCPGDHRAANAADAYRASRGPRGRRSCGQRSHQWPQERPFERSNGNGNGKGRRSKATNGNGAAVSDRNAGSTGPHDGGWRRVTTGRVDQERAPIWETLTGYARSGIYGFHTPGHKSGRFAAPEILAMVGKRGLELDLPAMTATDNLFHPTGCVFEAQRLASELFGSGETIFLTAGSTLGVATALLATVPQGHTVALPRNIHRSVVAGLVLSGALPRFIPHEVLPECGALGVTAERAGGDAGS